MSEEQVRVGSTVVCKDRSGTVCEALVYDLKFDGNKTICLAKRPDNTSFDIFQLDITILGIKSPKEVAEKFGEDFIPDSIGVGESID